PSPEAVKAKTFEALSRLVRRSRLHALILVLEDLHWVDTISEEFLAFLAEAIAGARILLLATYRPGYRPPWIDKSYAGQIPLEPLSRADSLAVVRSLSRPLAAPMTEAILAKADGNPLFLEQLALHAGETSDAPTAGAVPDTIHDVVMARIDRLPEETKRLLQTAAVIGREFSLQLLRMIWRGVEPPEIHLRELARLEFIYERSEGERAVYVFRHALTQETAALSLLERTRRSLHAEVGRAIETLYEGRTDEVAERLAFHFGRGDEAEKAVDYALLAAGKAQRRCAYSEALAYFDDALRRLDALPDSGPNRSRRIDAVLKQAEVKLALGRHAEHIAALAAIRGSVDRSDEPRQRVAWHYWTGFLHCLTGGHPSVAIAQCRRAAEIAATARFSELDGFIFSSLAQAHVVAGELTAAIEAGERALAIFEARGEAWPASRALWHLSATANCLGEWEKSLAYCRRALDYAAALDDLRLKTAGLWRTGFAYIQQGDTERGLRYCDEALALHPIPYDSAVARMVRGYGLIKAGRVDTGIAELCDVAAWLERSQLIYVHLLATLCLAAGHLLRGEAAHARPLVERALEKCRTAGYLYYEGLAHRLLGECLAAAAPAAAEEHVGNALRIFDRIGARNDFAKALVTRATLRRRAGDVAAARRLLEEARGIFVALGTRGEPERVAAALADLDRGAASAPAERARPVRSPAEPAG
ncbi:MAG TPA: hypothetical protein VE993_04785, partial [Stellaceae bacterium]|nr:hypothetical protein [Stellaceae bacterium]